MPEKVGAPNADPYRQHSAREIGGTAATQSGGLPQEDQEYVEDPHPKRKKNLGIKKIGSAERCFLDKYGAQDEADRHAGEAEEQHDVGEALEGVQERHPIERDPPGVLAGLALRLRASLLYEI